MSGETHSDAAGLTGPIAWMARNSIAANLAMIVLLVGGVMFASRVTQEVFPDFDLDVVTVHVDYPGASPAEVEQGILRSVEDRVEGLDDVKKVTSYAVEGGGTVSVEVTSGGDRDKLLQDVKNEVDRITTFPVEAEQPEVGLASRRRQVLSVIVHGDVPEGSLRAYAERVRDALVARDGITLVELTNVRGHEVAIEIPESELRALGISLPQVARIVSDNALELAAGEVKVSSGAVLLRTQERRDAGLEFADLPLVTSPDGTVVRIGDVGRVVDGFEETDLESRFDGIPAIEVVVYRVGDETPLQVAATSREVLADLESDAPEAIGLEVWDDQSATYGARIDLLSRNALLGLGLVLLLLGLFLEPRIAFWVTIGIMISVVGSFLVFPATGATINLVSLFAFIVTLGIVVDDAIIVGENIYEWRSRGVPPLEAAIRGTREIAAPVVFAVLTNIVAFMPLFFVPGASGKIFLQIPAVVVSVFAISLVESLFILPAHLAHDVKPGRLMRLLSAPNRAVTRGFDRFSETVFAPLVTASLRGRYVVPALGIALLMVSVGVVRGGFVRWSFLPRVDSDVISVDARLAVGAPVTEARRVAAELEGAARAAAAGIQDDLVAGIFTRVGNEAGQASELQVRAQLIDPGERSVGGADFARAWRAEVGRIVGTEAVTFSASSFGQGTKPIDVQLFGPEQELLERAAAELAAQVSAYAGVSDVDDGTAAGKRQLSFTLTPAGRAAGFTSTEVANQVRSAFFGAEALRQQRGRDEVKVIARLPRSERERLSTVENLILRTPAGGEMPLSTVATVDSGRSYTTINRRDGRRIVAVTAEVDPASASAGTILGEIQAEFLPDLARRYEGLRWSLAGEQESQAESLGALGVGLFLAMFVIFAMLAIPLKSYTLPMIVLSGAPFGVIGALLGHVVLGYGLSLMSLFGIIALTGVVVNDSLVLVVTAEGYRARGLAAFEAIRRASVRRLRPILLTSLTTSLGLLPMMLETSAQARFLVPMAISLGFGVLFSTFVILLLVPCLYLVREDLFAIGRVALGREAAPGAPETA